MNRFLSILLAMGLALPLSAAAIGSPPAAPSLDQRSPLLPGLWWDPQQAGHGFDLHLSGNTVGVLWYTYRADGRPVWYLASGQLDAAQALDTALLEARWDGQGMETREVGRLRLQRVHAESARLDWSLDGRSGRWQIEPFRISARRAEDDPSGAYHLPSRSGFGLSVEQQGEWQSSILYAYDDQGAPVWALGTRAPAETALELASYRGSCPGCEPQPATPSGTHSGSLQLAGGKATLRLSPLGAGGFGSAFRGADLDLQRFTPGLAERRADFALARFDSAVSLHDYLKITLANPRNWEIPGSGVDFSPPPPTFAVNISSTNLIEEGVDEAALLKSDGRRVYAFGHDGNGVPSATLRVAALDPALPSVTPIGEVPLASSANPLLRNGMYLDGQRLLVLRSGESRYRQIDFSPPPPPFWLSKDVQLESFEVDDGGLPQRRWQARIDGEMVDSRRIGNDLFLVLRFSSKIEGFRYGATREAEVAANQTLLEASKLEDLLPKIRIDDGPNEPLLDAGAVYLPPAAGQRLQPDLVVVLRIAADDPADREALAVVGGVAAIHVSQRSLYLTSSRFAHAPAHPPQAAARSYTSTDVHRIDFSDGTLRITGSGSVDGQVDPNFLRQPFRFSEHEGVLRVVTSGDFGERGRNLVSALAPSSVIPGMLTTLATLPNAAAPQPLGKPGEALYATRFVGPKLYAVTYQQIDPLYVVDLADPRAPAIRGELEVPGVSEYLHPLPDDLLLGIGYATNTSAQGWALFGGVQLSLFDVADPAAPRVIQQIAIGERGSGSALFSSHQALSVLQVDDDRLRFALPLRVHGLLEPVGAGSEQFQEHTQSGAQVFDVVGRGAAARLQKQGFLLTHRRGVGSPAPDVAATAARTLLTPAGMLYSGAGWFWTAPWTQLATPVGPR